MFITTYQKRVSELWRIFQSKPVRIQSQILSLVFGVVFLTYSITYCQFYLSNILQVSTSIEDSIIWALRTYGLWLIINPYLLISYSNFWPNHKGYITGFCIISFMLSTGYSVFLDFYFYSVPLASSLVVFVPTHITASAVVLLGWWILMRASLNVVQPDVSTLDTAKSLRVNTGTKEIDIAISDIESISAAGNYMEVFDGRQTYIVRATMKDLEEQLQRYEFVRIHRSYLVNRALIQTIHDNKSITLFSGQCLPITRRYLRNII